VIDLSDNLNDLADTAAVISQLDLVICVDSAVAHLAGALGKPIWILLCFMPDWRWMLQREDSPWYPTARLFRQQTAGDWEEVFDRVKIALKHLISLSKCLTKTREKSRCSRSLRTSNCRLTPPRRSPQFFRLSQTGKRANSLGYCSLPKIATNQSQPG
jgi:hypothetical protein